MVEGLPPDDFPTGAVVTGTPREEGATIPSESLVKAVLRAGPLASTHEHRATMCGVLVEAQDGVLQVVATDGLTLCRIRLPEPTTLSGQWIISRLSLPVLSKIFTGPVTVTATPSMVTLASDSRTLDMRTVEGPFPAWRQLISGEKREKIATVDRVALSAALSRVSALGAGVDRVALSWEAGQLTVTATVGDVGSGDDVIESSMEGTDLFRIGFVPSVLSMALGVHDAQRISIAMTNESRAVFIRDADQPDGPALSLALPIKLNH